MEKKSVQKTVSEEGRDASSEFYCSQEKCCKKWEFLINPAKLYMGTPCMVEHKSFLIGF